MDTVDLLASILRGDPVSAHALAAVSPVQICRDAQVHGVLPLVADRLANRRDVPFRLSSRLEQEAVRLAAADLVREAELRKLLAAFDQAELQPVLIKGVALAHSQYRRPDLRQRLDTDLLIPADGRPTADRVLLEAGYEAVAHVSGTWVNHQAPYVKRQDGATIHVLDLHWRISNPQPFAHVLSYDDLVRTAVRLPRLGASALGPSPVHALLLACVHRVAHHRDVDLLIWLHDIHLLASQFDAVDWDEFRRLMHERGVGSICREALQRTSEWFGTSIPDDVWAEAGEEGATDRSTAAYLAPCRRPVQNVLADLRALPSWAARWHLMCEHLFPPERYMRDVYAPLSSAPLAVLYARRALRGARRWLVRPS